MRLLLLPLLVLSLAAEADVGPRPPNCKVPPGCMPCGRDLRGEALGGDCAARAADAGLVESECTDRSGPMVTRYFCPKGSPATRPSCASIDGLGLGVLGALTFLLRRWARTPRDP